MMERLIFVGFKVESTSVSIIIEQYGKEFSHQKVWQLLEL